MAELWVPVKYGGNQIYSYETKHFMHPEQNKQFLQVGQKIPNYSWYYNH